MDMRPSYPTLNERMTSYFERGVRIATRFAIAFGLSTLTGIGIGVAVADNVLAQIFVTLLSAFALWIPFVVGVARWAIGTARQPGVPAGLAAAAVAGAGRAIAPNGNQGLDRPEPAGAGQGQSRPRRA